MRGDFSYTYWCWRGRAFIDCAMDVDELPSGIRPIFAFEAAELNCVRDVSRGDATNFIRPHNDFETKNGKLGEGRSQY